MRCDAIGIGPERAPSLDDHTVFGVERKVNYRSEIPVDAGLSERSSDPSRLELGEGEIVLAAELCMAHGRGVPKTRVKPLDLAAFVIRRDEKGRVPTALGEPLKTFGQRRDLGRRGDVSRGPRANCPINLKENDATDFEATDEVLELGIPVHSRAAEADKEKLAHF